jgi:hypothetical protein
MIADYSRGDYAALPADDTNLENAFSWTGYLNVATEDLIYEEQTATAEYSIFEFKNKYTNNTTPFTVTCVLKSTVPASTSTVYLQIYNRTLTTWQTLRTNTTAAADTPFTIQDTTTVNLTDYYDANFWVSFRVVQLIQ